MAIVYLLHFTQPISDNHTTQHYLGYTKSLKQRIADHKNGNAARLTQVALERGIDFVVAKTWSDGSRSLERHLKNQHNSPRLCPICQGLEKCGKKHL